VNDQELWLAALAELEKTTISGATWVSRGRPATGHWGAAVALGKQIGAPPPPPSGFGAQLAAAWLAPVFAGPTVAVGSLTALTAALQNPLAGATYDGGGRTFQGSAVITSRARPTQPTRFSNFTLQGAGIELSGCQNMYLGPNVTISGSPIDGLKIDGASSDCGWDGLTCEHSTRQGILLGSGSEASVKRIRGFNTITAANGFKSNGNLDHGLYACHVDGFVLANWLSYGNVAYAAQFYPQCRNGLVVSATFDGTGSTRGGIVFGTESGVAEPTQNVRVLAAIIQNAQNLGAAHILNGAPGCTVDDTLTWQGGGSSVPGTNTVEAEADPLDSTFKPTAGTPPRVRASEFGWLPATDLAGNARTTGIPGAYA
jgi:hypothetical protein